MWHKLERQGDVTDTYDGGKHLYWHYTRKHKTDNWYYEDIIRAHSLGEARAKLEEALADTMIWEEGVD
jgi:hypothetical protein